MDISLSVSFLSLTISFVYYLSLFIFLSVSLVFFLSVCLSLVIFQSFSLSISFYLNHFNFVSPLQSSSISLSLSLYLFSSVSLAISFSLFLSLSPSFSFALSLSTMCGWRELEKSLYHFPRQPFSIFLRRFQSAKSSRFCFLHFSNDLLTVSSKLCSVTRLCEILSLLQKFKRVWQFFLGLFSIWQNFEPTLA